MYRNTGAAIKVLATILAVLMMIGCVGIGLYYIIEFEEYEVGLPIMIGGCIVSWLSCLMMAAFGELVNNTHKILKLLKAMPQEKPVVVVPQPMPEYIAPAKKEEPVYASSVKFEQASGEDLNANANTCPTCGTPRKGSSAFCAFCGTKF